MLRPLIPPQQNTSSPYSESAALSPQAAQSYGAPHAADKLHQRAASYRLISFIPTSLLLSFCLSFPRIETVKE